MTPLEVGGLTLFILVLLLGTFSILFGFPGTVIILIDAFVYGAITGFEKIGLKILMVLLVLAVLAEVADFAVSMAGAVKFGVSRKGFWAFTVGGFVGALLLTPLFLGLGLLIGTFLGGFIAMLIVELLARGKIKPTLRASYGAILGRVAGTFVKGIFALIMVIVTLTNIYS
ncbi:MAG: DUF456 domain-containing protein [Deltaproteobacteria bacterium]|nr:DUF456 domain-containing protein [Deltaproteobacteria bacterium]